MEHLLIEWGKMKLNEEEGEAMEFEEDVLVEKREEIESSLIGKLLTQSNVNTRVMKAVVKSIWQPAKGLVIRDLDKNIFCSNSSHGVIKSLC